MGIVARLCDEADWLNQARSVAAEIASRPRAGQMLAKQALSAALELPLAGGIAFERSAYQVALASRDAREGLAAFADAREPIWSGTLNAASDVAPYTSRPHDLHRAERTRRGDAAET